MRMRYALPKLVVDCSACMLSLIVASSLEIAAFDRSGTNQKEIANLLGTFWQLKKYFGNRWVEHGLNAFPRFSKSLNTVK